MVNVVVIDTGICPEHNVFKNKRIQMLEYSRGKIHKGGYDNFGHGTAVSGIIAKNEEIFITSIKINGIENKANEDDLIYVLEYISQNIKADIINMSFGINVLEKKERLYSICEYLKNTGTVIVSAFDNTGTFSYPASFENVIGVISSESCRNINDIIYINDRIVNIAVQKSL